MVHFEGYQQDLQGLFSFGYTRFGGQGGHQQVAASDRASLRAPVEIGRGAMGSRLRATKLRSLATIHVRRVGTGLPTSFTISGKTASSFFRVPRGKPHLRDPQCSFGGTAYHLEPGAQADTFLAQVGRCFDQPWTPAPKSGHEGP